ncbi:hypothetical protein AMAG_13427 [Allomyces macrogynus ATCC 38327]|uniref:FHA domain-containing protein n=1 Tax=Allomyces macrogynus (strain ATCC 38327) TaxID=578462 RepID=A0A0L0T211_ALLM3|nr:hypothetical protein AMAG_13427 [Allomyces macrogynus ATCC 38327]|eukprot:KNE68786.1 hypothetical protein AMAG_13427 [Allomyces macrogynus ATCC 38327]
MSDDSGFKKPSARPSSSGAMPADAPPLPYNPPTWSSIPTEPWKFEVLKNGVIVQEIAYPETKPFLTVGRLPTCDVDLEHPSISRYHAVLQFSDQNELFLFDLSTHGTTLNKKLVPSRQHVRVRSGDMIRFGASSRLFIVHGPRHDEEQLERENAAHEQLARHRQQHRPQPTREAEDEEPLAVSWGFGEDAVETPLDGAVLEDDEGTIAPPANASFLKDPRKTLTEWLDARGLNLAFDHAEQGSGRDREYMARLEVSLESEGAAGTVVGTGNGSRKRDAERAAIIQVLAKLDRMGFLVGSRANLQQQRMRELMGDVDDGDDDEFFDRTGGMSKKGRGEPAQTKKTVETYESLLDKKTALADDRAKLDGEIAALERSASGTGDDDEDELDQFMHQLDQDQQRDKIRALQKQRDELDRELARVDQLLVVAAPTQLTLSAPNRATSPGKFRSAAATPSSSASPSTRSPMPGPKRPKEEPESKPEPKKRRVGPAVGPTRPPAAALAPFASAVAGAAGAGVGEEVETDVVWVPPANQRGDGWTALNDKYGY